MNQHRMLPKGKLNKQKIIASQFAKRRVDMKTPWIGQKKELKNTPRKWA